MMVLLMVVAAAAADVGESTTSVVVTAVRDADYETANSPGDEQEALRCTPMLASSPSILRRQQHNAITLTSLPI